jgi:cytochrome c oxidase subunit 2
MSRPPVFGLVLLVVLAFVASGCSHSRPGGKIVTPTATKVVGKAPTAELPGKAVFVSQGCGACHTFKPAGTTGTVGPDLDKLAQYSQAANQASLQDFTSTAITDPGAYVEKGFAAGVMPTTYSSLSAQQLSDLVAFLTQP